MLDARDCEDRPFGCPPDVVLDIPLPPSVNRTRRIDPAAAREVERWKKQADMLLMASGQFRATTGIELPERFELQIILCEKKCRQDLDNSIKAAIDYLRRIELIRNDDKRYLRRLTVTWGEAPAGCRLVLRGCA
jgi:Holliday junction resolvase RusA-like endonuclease